MAKQSLVELVSDARTDLALVKGECPIFCV
jgi:hypothetical protein